jgi:hypothetical protein
MRDLAVRLFLLSFRARFIFGILPFHDYYTLYVTNRILKILKKSVYDPSA